MPQELNKNKLHKLAVERAYDILSAWFTETPDIWEFQEEHDLTDEEIGYIMNDVWFDIKINK